MRSNIAGILATFLVKSLSMPLFQTIGNWSKETSKESVWKISLYYLFVKYIYIIAIGTMYRDSGTIRIFLDSISLFYPQFMQLYYL